MAKKKKLTAVFLATALTLSRLLGGCGKGENAEGKFVIELVQYKP